MADIEKVWAERRQQRIDREYTELRALDPDLFRECVEAANAIIINNPAAVAPDNDLRVRLGAQIEQSLVSIALRAMRRNNG